MKHLDDCPCHLTLKQRVASFSPHFTTLQNLQNKDLRRYCKNISICHMRHLFFCAKAFLDKDIELERSIYPQFNKYQNALIQLGSRNISLKQKRDYLLKRGGQLGLIPLLASVVGPIIGEWVAKKFRGT
jgi:hypothetical protein